MRTPVFTAIFAIALAAGAYAHDAPKRPETPAPAATAAFEARESWCQIYTTWFVGVAPAARPEPADVRPNHRLEVEFNSCKLDPQAYERETRAETPRSALEG